MIDYCVIDMCMSNHVQDTRVMRCEVNGVQLGSAPGVNDDETKIRMDSERWKKFRQERRVDWHKLREGNVRAKYVGELNKLNERTEEAEYDDDVEIVEGKL